ncbi:hypothetical protein Ahy_B07g087086 [Arachis hypogaea]|uniref:Myb/SANT-like domain-containing protein n=1 Tax=Arachis hypogaea TaxID=3818 RepID=A0A444YB66_ARAHY|nr:hypothetical protein Ahy_B07g087086 [Arachis hypogaea]
MLACSGFGWNSKKQCVVVDSKDVLDAWMKAHPTKFYTPGKPFPLFHQLEGIFGKDRATGAGAVSGFDAEEQVDEEIEDQTQGFYDSDMSANPTIDRGQGQASHSNVGAGPGNTRHSSRKRRQTDLLERMAEHIQQSSVTQSQNAQLIADALVGVNGKFKIGEKLEQLGFREDEVVQHLPSFHYIILLFTSSSMPPSRSDQPSV